MFNILTYLEKSAAQYPDKIAFADKDKSITYEELVKRSKGIGSQLAKQFSPRTPIPVFMEKKCGYYLIVLWNSICRMFLCFTRYKTT